MATRYSTAGKYQCRLHSCTVPETGGSKLEPISGALACGEDGSNLILGSCKHASLPDSLDWDGDSLSLLGTANGLDVELDLGVSTEALVALLLLLLLRLVSAP